MGVVYIFGKNMKHRSKKFLFQKIIPTISYALITKKFKRVIFYTRRLQRLNKDHYSVYNRVQNVFKLNTISLVMCSIIMTLYRYLILIKNEK